MNKLLAVVVASAFALGSVSAFAANTATQPQAQPGVKHTVTHKAQKMHQAKGTVHHVKQGKKAKRHARKARKS